jgi:hypothetical protein
MVIDGGYKDAADTIINHIATHFGRDRHINHMVLTHPDHATGLIGVMERTRVLNLWMNRPWLYADEVINHFHGNFSRAALIEAMKERHADEEARDQNAADDFYAAAGTWLRENTRDAKKFSILFNENVMYGFRRNLLGLRWPAAILNLIICVFCVALLWPVTWPLNMNDDLTVRVVIVLVVALIHGLYLVFGVTWRAAEEAANTYGRQLLISTEAFLVDATPPRQPRTKKTAAV